MVCSSFSKRMFCVCNRVCWKKQKGSSHPRHNGQERVESPCWWLELRDKSNTHHLIGYIKRFPSKIRLITKKRAAQTKQTDLSWLRISFSPPIGDGLMISFRQIPLDSIFPSLYTLNTCTSYTQCKIAKKNHTLLVGRARQRFPFCCVQERKWILALFFTVHWHRLRVRFLLPSRKSLSIRIYLGSILLCTTSL